jgi:glyoxylase-like metal-dependent hydrolase (beta-lactamase superfamily II)
MTPPWYAALASQMHPKSGVPPVASSQVGEVKFFNIAEACYDVDVGFLFQPADIPLIESGLVNNNQVPGMRFGCCLVRLPDGTNVLLDGGPFGPPNCGGPGLYSHPCPEPPPDPLDLSLKKIGIALDDIDFVIYSHLHGDHVGWASALTKATHVMHKREMEYASFPGSPWNIPTRLIFGPIHESGRLILIDGKEEEEAPIDAERLPGFSLLLVDGHTPGHSVVKMSIKDCSEGEPKMVYYIGDSLHSTVQLQQPEVGHVADCCCWKERTFLPFSMVDQTWSEELRNNPRWNAQTSSEGRKTLLSSIHEDGGLLISPHFPFPGMGYLSLKEDSGYEIKWSGTAEVLPKS